MKNINIKKENFLWILVGLAVSTIGYFISFFLYFLMSKPYDELVILLVILSVFIIKKEKRDELEKHLIFDVINPEIFIFISLFAISFENEIWRGLYQIKYYGLNYGSDIEVAISGSFDYILALLLFWFLSFSLDRIIRNEKWLFFEKSWLYNLFLFFKKKRYERFYKRKKNQVTALYNVIKEMAAGNLDAELPQKLGIYEPFRPELDKLKDSIRIVVEKELKSERMKLELVENVSHDLKTPLTAIITYIDLLKEETDEEKRKEYTEIVSKRADRLKILIEDLFEVTKASTGNLKLEPVEADIVNLVKQVVFEYSERFKERNLEIDMDLPEKKIYVNVDPQKTYRIYANLFGNIAKYSLKNSRVYVKIDETDTEAVIVLKNISQAKLTMNGKDLAERFVRGDASRNTEGSGLGLAIAKNFTELQGGSFDIVTDGDLFKAVTIWKKNQ